MLHGVGLPPMIYVSRTVNCFLFQTPPPNPKPQTPNPKPPLSEPRGLSRANAPKPAGEGAPEPEAFGLATELSVP